MTNGAVDNIIKPLVTAAGLEDIVKPLLDINMAQVRTLDLLSAACKNAV